MTDAWHDPLMASIGARLLGQCADEDLGELRTSLLQRLDALGQDRLEADRCLVDRVHDVCAEHRDAVRALEQRSLVEQVDERHAADRQLADLLQDLSDAYRQRVEMLDLDRSAVVGALKRVERQVALAGA